MDLQGYALVTGAGSGIGLAVAHMFAKEGCAGVAFADINSTAAQAAAEASKAIATNPAYKALVLTVDIRKKEDAQKMVDETVKAFGRLDYAVNCAGVYINVIVPASQLPSEEFDRIMSVNVNGNLYCLQAETEAMKKNLPKPNPYSEKRLAERGSIVTIASVASWIVGQYGMSYAASKHAIYGVIKGAALDHAADLIRINGVYPGWVQTPMLEAALAAVPPESKLAERMKAMTPIARTAEPEEVADAVMFLASQRASWITGTGITVDGGMCIWPGSHHDV